MAKLAGRTKISLGEMSQTINTNRYLGKNSTAEERILFAELSVEIINERTLDGETIHGGSFKKYDDDYAAKKGVTVDSVDLFANGDMLDSVSESVKGKDVNIDVVGSLQTKKAYNHHIGDTAKKRPWFGVTTTEARRIGNSIKALREEGVTPKKATTTLIELKEALSLITIEQIE